MTASEAATINFYRWEYRHRGYYHFDTPIDIEYQYLPFEHSSHQSVPVQDDGRLPSLFQSIGKFLIPSTKKEEPEDIEKLIPHFIGARKCACV